MDLNKIKEGKRVAYTSRANEGKGTVLSIQHKGTGSWVTVFDKARNANVTVRPSQIRSA
jgi:hypothetical protein